MPQRLRERRGGVVTPGGDNGNVPSRFLISVAETSFLAYLHYLEDIAAVVRGRYGDGIDGVYQ